MATPISLQKQCMVYVACHLEYFSPDTLTLLPRTVQTQLVHSLPVADVCALEETALAQTINFDSNIHDPEYQWVDDDGVLKCTSVFSTIVERGDLVGSGEVFEQTYYPSKHNQTCMGLVFHCSMEKDVWYVTGRRGKGSRLREPVKVYQIGKIVIEMPNMTGDKNRAVDVTFDFSHTEIQVKAFDRTSKNEVTTVLDFLTC